MKCHTNVNSTPFTQLPHKFSYIVAILGHNHFESPNMSIRESKWRQITKKLLQNSFAAIEIRVLKQTSNFLFQDWHSHSWHDENEMSK
jgi:hypothetical protein